MLYILTFMTAQIHIKIIGVAPLQACKELNILLNNPGGTFLLPRCFFFFEIDTFDSSLNNKLND